MQFTFDPIEFLFSGAQLAPAVVFVVIALTYFSERFGLKGKGQLAFALILGFLMGGGLQLAKFVPDTFADWFTLIVYALVMAVTPSLVYEQAKELILKMTAKTFGSKYEEPR